tara:strand:- start:230 stop:547 length:318 start_codon:yes stop_codon:yes gene_type:complete
MHPAHAHLYAHVHVVFWPWLWLQLWNLNRWMKESGQGLLISVDRRGTIYVNAISDAPEQGPGSISAPVSARLAAALAPEIEISPCPQLPLGIRFPVHTPGPIPDT